MGEKLDTGLIEVRRLLEVLWTGRFVSGVICLVIVLASSVWIYCSPNIYRAQVLLAPVNGAADGGVNAIVGRLGGIASLAGVSLAGNGDDKTLYALEVLKSKAFITDFIRRHDLVQPLMFAKSWDQAKRTLHFYDTELDPNTNRLVRSSYFSKGGVTDLDCYLKFIEALRTVQNKETGYVTISIDHLSPDIAKEWVDLLVIDLNEKVREVDIKESKSVLEYLNEKLTDTSVSEMRAIFFQLIEEHTKTVMVAEIRNDYVFKVVDPAVVPERRHKPKRILLLILSVVLGGIAGIAYVVMRFLFKKVYEEKLFQSDA